MELTIEQTLQQGVTAHQEGKLQEAGSLYRAILQSEPTHPDANHNLGLIAISLNDSAAALTLFKIALDANPKIEQFWFSYIDALIKENQIKNAKRAIKKAKKKRFDSKKLEALLSQSKVPADGKEPPQVQLNILLEHYQAGRYGDAEKLAVSITQEFPKHQLGWKVLGAVLGQTGKKLEALNANQKAVELSPQDAEAHNNFGNRLIELGRLEDAEASLRQAVALKFDFFEAHNNLGNALQKLGRLEDAEASLRQAIALKPDFFEAHNNLGITLKKQDRLEDAEASFRQAIVLKSDFDQAHCNLGITLTELGRLEDAEASYRQAITLKSDFFEAYNNLGITLQKQDRLEEAEASYTQAIRLKPDYTEALWNLGTALQDLGRLAEAEASYTQAIALEPDYAEAHNNLGNALQKLGRLEDAEASFRQAIATKPDYAEAHNNLGIIIYGNGDINSALTSIERANLIDPKSRVYSLLLRVVQARKKRKTSKVSIENINNSDCNLELPRKIFMLDRPVEKELLTCLYELSSVNLHKENDPSFGNTRGSLYQLFRDDHHHPIIKYFAKDLESILIKALNSDIFVDESFFSIFGVGGGTTTHNHINSRDKDPILNLANQKYSLVYYLSIGDQECSEPGILKFYEPSEDILPTKGLITIFPSDRSHSSVYGGNKDRVIIGVNFYCL
jgi:Flp pilus assembly protein TadD